MLSVVLIQIQESIYLNKERRIVVGKNIYFLNTKKVKNIIGDPARSDIYFVTLEADQNPLVAARRTTNPHRKDTKSEIKFMKKYVKKLNREFDKNRQLSLPDGMAQSEISMILQRMAELQVAVESLRAENNELKNHVNQIPINPAISQPVTIPLRPLNISYANPNDINLDVFKALPVFDGNIAKYRIWREDVSRLMDGIKAHQNSNRYAEALSIVKTKIQGAAADVITNHNTIFNFDAIRNRLDYTYADQRPLYVLQDEMKKLNQGRNNLSQFHDEINKALTLITSKIAMSGHPEQVINVMTQEATQEAVRVFKDGINNSYIRSTLYGNPIKDLEHAYAVARTIEHDDEHRKLRLSYHNNELKPPTNNFRQNNRKFIPGKHRRPNYEELTYNQQPQPEPMDTSSGNTAPRRNHQGFHSQPWKRIREQSGNFNQTFNQNPKVQRNNKIEAAPIQDDNDSTTTRMSKSQYNCNYIHKDLN